MLVLRALYVLTPYVLVSCVFARTWKGLLWIVFFPICLGPSTNTSDLPIHMLCSVCQSWSDAACHFGDAKHFHLWVCFYLLRFRKNSCHPFRWTQQAASPIAAEQFSFADVKFWSILLHNFHGQEKCPSLAEWSEVQQFGGYPKEAPWRYLRRSDAPFGSFHWYCKSSLSEDGKQKQLCIAQEWLPISWPVLLLLNESDVKQLSFASDAAQLLHIQLLGPWRFLAFNMSRRSMIFLLMWWLLVFLSFYRVSIFRHSC